MRRNTVRYQRALPSSWILVGISIGSNTIGRNLESLNGSDFRFLGLPLLPPPPPKSYINTHWVMTHTVLPSISVAKKVDFCTRCDFSPSFRNIIFILAGLGSSGPSVKTSGSCTSPAFMRTLPSGSSTTVTSSTFRKPETHILLNHSLLLKLLYLTVTLER